MGLVKEKLLQEGAFGLESNRPEKRVCAECIEELALQDIIAKYADKEVCEYCGRQDEKPIAARLDVVTLHMANCINRVYCDPAETLPYESSEGGYIGDVYELSDLLDDIGFDVSDDTLRDDIYDSFDREYWAERDWQILDPGQRLIHGWKTFVHAVKHERRYTFWSMDDPNAHPTFDDHPDNMPVGQMLDKIAKVVTEAGFLRELPTNTPLWRVRIHKADVNVSRDIDLSSPPRICAVQPNRMSPAGIPMFYGSEDFETAVAETLDLRCDAGKRVSGGCFHPIRPLIILDLFDLPAVPSFFDYDAFDIRYTLIFLHTFARSVSQPIAHDGREPIEYVPTQAFSEYVRYRMANANGRAIDGIRFRSSKNGKASYVVFCEQDQCVEKKHLYGHPQLLKFDESTLRTEEARG